MGGGITIVDHIMGASIGDLPIMVVEFMEEAVVVLAIKTVLSAADLMVGVEIIGAITEDTTIITKGTVLETRVPLAVENRVEAATEIDQGGM